MAKKNTHKYDITLTNRQLNDFEFLLEFLEAYSDYYADDEPVEDDGEPTDAMRISKALPSIKKAFAKRKKHAEKPKQKPTPEDDIAVIHEHDSKVIYKDVVYQDIDNLVYNIAKKERESVNPNYKYCLCDTDLRNCYLSDDITDIMEFGTKLSKTNDRMFNVLEIFKAHDGSYKTRIIGCCDSGHYEESGRSVCGDYLHFYYIAQIATMHKIPGK